MALSVGSLSDITSKAKDQWKKKKNQKPAKRTSKKQKQNGNKSKSKQKNNKKRSIKQIDKKNAKETNNKPPSKKRKFDKKEKKKIDYNLSLKLQKKRSVIKLQNMPTGLEERQMFVFFKQFGTVTRCCLKRHRYGRSLRYGYVEFAHPEIAKIVENTLDCTSMYGEMIICKEIPAEKVNGSQFFKQTTIEQARLHKKLDNDKVRWQNAATITNLEFQFDEWHKTLIEDEKMIKRQLKGLGIEYEFDGFGKEIRRINGKNKKKSEKSDKRNGVSATKQRVSMEKKAKDKEIIDESEIVCNAEEDNDMTSFLSDDSDN